MLVPFAAYLARVAARAEVSAAPPAPTSPAGRPAETDACSDSLANRPPSAMGTAMLSGRFRYSPHTQDGYMIRPLRPSTPFAIASISPSAGKVTFSGHGIAFRAAASEGSLSAPRTMSVSIQDG